MLAKQPRAGFVKTRLTPPLDPAAAAALYESMLADVLDASARIAPGLHLTPVLAVHPPDACVEMAQCAPRGFCVIAQRGRDLAQRMAWAADEAAAWGAAPILLRGSDSPALGPATIRAAVEALRSHDLTLCPDRDGGYNLVGLARPARGLFAHAMSTPSVLEDTLANARSLGLSTHLLPPGFDIDTIEDLRWLAAARHQVEEVCPRTLETVDRLEDGRYSTLAPKGR